MQNRTILPIRWASQNRAGLSRVLMRIILPLPAMGHGRIKSICKLAILIKLGVVGARSGKKCLCRKFFQENIKRLAPDAVTCTRVEWLLKHHRAPRLCKQFACQCMPQWYFFLHIAFFFHLALFYRELACWLPIGKHHMLKARKLTHGDLAFPWDLPPAGASGGGFFVRVND